MSCVSLIVLPLFLAASPAPKIEGAARHPTVSITPDDVLRARERVKSDAESKAWFDELRQGLAAWDKKDPAWVHSVMPGKGACFAYGFTGCPICGKSWGIWGRANANFENPGHVTCAGGHTLPNEQFPDTGTGYVGPDKRIHYFVGSYNAWVVETLTQGIGYPYATLYLLTGDERAGRMAAVVLDELANIYPSCSKGSWDYPSKPPSGRLDRPWYQVARVLVILVEIYDRIHGHAALDEPSVTPGLTRRENIERNLLMNGAAYCYDESKRYSRLHNGQADYLRGVLAVGVALGIPEYVTWPVDGPTGIRTMLANNVDRDGRYFETSFGYGLHTRHLYLTFAEPLVNYRGSVFPNGLNLYDDARFQAFLTLPQLSMTCLGHRPPYGDEAPETTRTTPPYRPRGILDHGYAEMLAARVSDQQRRNEYVTLLRELESRYPGVRADSKDLAEWRVFHGPDSSHALATELPEQFKDWLDGSTFFGQQGFAVLRRGEGPAARAALLRYGPSLNHGHMDDLNVNYFADGYELTYDIGYSLGSTHTQVGWARQTASHNVAIVNSKSQSGASGGSLHLFGKLAPVTVAEASSLAYAQAGASTYRRLLAMTDEYTLDVFRVAGGRQHDLPLHSFGTDLEFEGLKFGPAQPGSLAGQGIEWGKLQLNDGDMKGQPNRPYWNPPPGNGYGFMVEPHTARPQGNWSATWRLDDSDKTRFQTLALGIPREEVVWAIAPGLYPQNPKAGCIIRRPTDDAPSSCFVSIWQSGPGSRPLPAREVKQLSKAPLSADTPLALGVELGDGRRDLWLLAPAAGVVVEAEDEGKPLQLDGAFAHCRLDDRGLLSAAMLDASRLQVAGWTLSLDSAERTTTVGGLPQGATLPVMGDWPQDDRYAGSPLYVSSPGESRKSGYIIAGSAPGRIRVRNADTILGRGVVEAVSGEHTLVTSIPHEYACCFGNCKASSFFQGKLLRSEDGSASTTIRSIAVGKTVTIEVESTKGFQVGQRFLYHDVQPGDKLTVQHFASLVRLSPQEYELRTNTDVTLAAPEGAAVEYVDATGQTRIAENGRIPRATLAKDGRTKVTVKLPKAS